MYEYIIHIYIISLAVQNTKGLSRLKKKSVGMCLKITNICITCVVPAYFWIMLPQVGYTADATCEPVCALEVCRWCRQRGSAEAALSKVRYLSQIRRQDRQL